MTVEHIGVMRGEKLSVKIPYDRVPENASLQSYTNPTDDEEDSTAMLKAGMTRLRIDGNDVEFDGFRWFPEDFRGDRRHAEDADVDFDGLPMGHPARDWDVADLVRRLRSGSVEILPKRYTEE